MGIFQFGKPDKPKTGCFQFLMPKLPRPDDLIVFPANPLDCVTVRDGIFNSNFRYGQS